MSHNSSYKESQRGVIDENSSKHTIIIQQTRAMPIYGQKVIVIRHPYITDILQYM